MCLLTINFSTSAQNTQGQDTRPPLKCLSEVKNLCGGMPNEIGEEKFISCMQEKGSQLSSECQKKPSERGNVQGQSMQNQNVQEQSMQKNRPSQKCLSEIKTLCGGMPYEIGEEKFISCMQEKGSQLSSECQRKPGAENN